MRDDLKIIVPRLAVAMVAGFVLSFAGGWVLAVLDASTTVIYVFCGLLVAFVVAATVPPALVALRSDELPESRDARPRWRSER